MRAPSMNFPSPVDGPEGGLATICLDASSDLDLPLSMLHSLISSAKPCLDAQHDEVQENDQRHANLWQSFHRSGRGAQSMGLGPVIWVL